MATIDYLIDQIGRGKTLHELTGYVRSPVDHRDQVAAPSTGATLAPQVYMNTWANMTALDQGQVPKCVACSLTTGKMLMTDDETGSTPFFDDDEFYSHIAMPGGGADIRTALLWLLNTGLEVKGTPTDLRKIKTFSGVVPTDHAGVMTMISTAGGVEVGFDVPQSFMRGGGKEFHVAAGQTGEPGADPIVGGHGIYVPGYDQNGPWFKNTWGDDWPTPGAHGLVQVSWDFWDTYVTECWVVQD